MLPLLPLILRNVRRNRRRTLLTLASTAVSLAILGFLVALYQGFFFREQASPNEARRLIVRHKVSLTNPLPAAYGPRIASLEGVAAVSAWSWFGGIYKDDRPENMFARLGVDPEQFEKIHEEYVAPREQWSKFEHDRTGCAIGRAIADKHNMKLGDRITIQGDIYPVNLELTIDCIYDHPKNQCMVFQREYLTQLLKAKGREGDNVGTYSILAKTPEDVHIAVDTMFENSPYPTKSETERQFEMEFMSFLGNIKLYLAVICSAVTFTILLVSANTVAMSVRERTREMGILRCIGYTPAEIMRLVLGESVFIALLGGVLGIAVTAILTRAAAAGLGPWGEAIKFRWEATLIVAALAAVIGLVSAFVPAVFASRRNIVEAIRFAG